jgi:hypothetical protein
LGGDLMKKKRREVRLAQWDENKKKDSKIFQGKEELKYYLGNSKV